MNDETEGQAGSAAGKQYSVQGFSEVEVSSAVKFEITQSPDYSVKAVGDEKLIEHLNVDVSGQTLRIGLRSGLHFFSLGHSDGNVKVTVTMPRLRKLTASGACNGVARGFKSTDDFDLELSGASRAEIDIEAGKTTATVSGAGRISGALKAQSTSLTLSGASRCELTGTGGDTRLSVSGAGQADLSGFRIQNADLELSGASRAKINMDGTLNASLSGASQLEYTGNVTLGRTSSTGASKLRGGEQ